MSSVGPCRTVLLSEFAPSFWEQDEVQTFMQKWFNDSLDGYLNQNQELKAAFGEKLTDASESDDSASSACGLFR